MWGAYIRGRGAYTRGNNKMSNFNFPCNVKLIQITITVQQLMVSPDQSKGQIPSYLSCSSEMHLPVFGRHENVSTLSCIML